MSAKTPGQAAREALLAAQRRRGDDTRPTSWDELPQDYRDDWEGIARAARDHRGVLPPTPLPPEEACTPEETAYEAFTARRGTSRIAWEALDPEERADWRGVVKALASRPRRGEPQSAPDLGAAYADLQSEIRNAVSLHCSGPGVPCDLCLRETDRAMKAVDTYARDVAQHERTREQPAPELAAAMAETAKIRDLFDQATKAVLTKRWALTDSEKRIISGFRSQAGLPSHGVAHPAEPATENT